jgi:hypothetical protein
LITSGLPRKSDNLFDGAEIPCMEASRNTEPIATSPGVAASAKVPVPAKHNPKKPMAACRRIIMVGFTAYGLILLT